MVEAIASESEAVALHLPRVARLARKLDGLEGAEFDDLYQEGSIAVLSAVREERRPSDMEITRDMFNWIEKCRRWRRHESMSEEMLDYQTGIHSDPGRRKTYWQEDGEMKGGWTEHLYAPK